jgi:hypothetical protein
LKLNREASLRVLLLYLRSRNGGQWGSVEENASAIGI